MELPKCCWDEAKFRQFSSRTPLCLPRALALLFIASFCPRPPSGCFSFMNCHPHCLLQWVSFSFLPISHTWLLDPLLGYIFAVYINKWESDKKKQRILKWKDLNFFPLHFLTSFKVNEINFWGHNIVFYVYVFTQPNSNYLLEPTLYKT